MSVRLPPEPTLRTWPLPLCVSVWPFKSSVTTFVTVSVASPTVAATSFVSVTVPPALSCACSCSHGVGGVVERITSPFASRTKTSGLSLKKYTLSPAAAPAVNVTGADAVGAVAVVTPMRAPGERPFTVIVRPE